jgi:hypothetical protein
LRDRLSVTSDVKLKVAVPPGSRFRGYEDVLVQDLEISVSGGWRPRFLVCADCGTPFA